MPTIFLQTFTIEPSLLQVIVAGMFALAAAYLGWRLSRRKTEFEMAMSILARLEPLKFKSIEDQIAITKLEGALQDCVDGRTTCREQKETILALLMRAEGVIRDLDGSNTILAEFADFRLKLET